MAYKKQPFQRTIDKTAVVGTNSIEDQQVKDGYLYCYQRVAVVNITTKYTRLRILVQGAGKDFMASEQQTPQANELYWDDVPTYVTEGRKLVAELTGCTADDDLQMHVTGWYQKIEGKD